MQHQAQGAFFQTLKTGSLVSSAGVLLDLSSSSSCKFVEVKTPFAVWPQKMKHL
jgi:hypothetical protein